MKSKLFACVVALATVVLPPLGPRAVRAAEAAGAPVERIAEIDIGRIKAALRLTAAQLPHWAPVEATLIDLSRRPKPQADSDGYLRRLGRRALTIAVDGAATARLAAAARPLIASLDQEQRQTALRLARDMGLGQMVASLN